jgi:murein peptide amidase A
MSMKACSHPLLCFLVLLGLFSLSGCARLGIPSPFQQAGHVESTEADGEVVVEVELIPAPEIPEVIEPYMTRERSAPTHTRAILDFCRKIDQRFLHWGWGLSGCRDFQWNHVRDSVEGDPLMWVVFGDEGSVPKNEGNITLIMCGIHGDEITPIKFCFDILHELNSKYNHPDFKDTLVVVYPIANPDSFFRDRPTRTNSRGVDVNRNLPTKDWEADALRLWRTRHRSDPRRYPGERAMSEPETVTQVNLIRRYGPQKIISVHAPLTILDYDGPVEITPQFGEVGSRASELLIQMSKKADGYQVRNFPFFPGSLGNYAGNERGIPTYTLELPSSDNRRHRDYWELFRTAIRAAIVHDLKGSSESKVVEHKTP